jgi:APA family basic amino acid/polyamine antiporter
VWSGFLVLSGSASALGRYTGFAVVLFAGVAVAALFVLRSREPAAPRPFRALGYPIAPAVFVVASLLIVANAIYGDPIPSGAGVLIILAGIPIYAIFARRVAERTERTEVTVKHREAEKRR